MSDIKVSFPAPCEERWEGMTPTGCNRHCAACDKVIHDLAAMTLAEVETLTQQEGEVCVRARIAPDGTIVLASRPAKGRRKLMAVTAATMSLAAAACQTPMVGKVSPRYEITGQTYSWYHAARLRLVSDSGKVHRPAPTQDGAFRFTNLRPGTYTPRAYDSCGSPLFAEQVKVEDADVDLGQLKWKDDQDECIIVGVMVPADEWRG